MNNTCEKIKPTSNWSILAWLQEKILAVKLIDLGNEWMRKGKQVQKFLYVVKQPKYQGNEDWHISWSLEIKNGYFFKRNHYIHCKPLALIFQAVLNTKADKWSNLCFWS